jgi:hypothetical protein
MKHVSWYPPLRDMLSARCRRCRFWFRTRGVPCLEHTRPSERAARAKAIGVTR